MAYPTYTEAPNPQVLATVPSGSALAPGPNDPTVFYSLTDRGPNAAGVAAKSIIFSKADFIPQIGKFRPKDNQLVLRIATFDIAPPPPSNTRTWCKT